jgi:phage-related protein
MLTIPRKISPFKRVIWLGGSKADLRTFPPDVRHEAGYQLEGVQNGGVPQDWKPMGTIGPGVREIRIRDAAGAFRVVYLATRPEGVYVLHCFQKKDRKTSRQDIALAKNRFKDIPTAKDSADEGSKPHFR